MTRLLNSRRDFGRSYYWGKDLEKVESDRADSKGEDMNDEKLEFKNLKRKYIMYHKSRRRRNWKRRFGEKTAKKQISQDKISKQKELRRNPTREDFKKRFLEERFKRVIMTDELWVLHRWGLEILQLNKETTEMEWTNLKSDYYNQDYCWGELWSFVPVVSDYHSVDNSDCPGVPSLISNGTPGQKTECPCPILIW